MHKGLRLALFELAEAAGSLDPSDQTDVKAFTTLFGDVEMMLETHHGHEDGEHLAGLIESHAHEAGASVGGSP